jgi:hypothetical protein
MGMFKSRFREKPKDESVKKENFWKQEWSEVVANKLTPEMLAWENEFFGMPSEFPATRWLNLVQAVVKNESNFDPVCVFVEEFKDDTTGELCRSCGLLQMSEGDKNSYPESETLQLMENEDQLFDPIFNLKCGLEVMHIIISRGEKSLRSYWSTMNEDDEKGEATRQTLQELLGE